MRKVITAASILLLIISFTACHKPESQDLPKEQANNDSQLTQSISPMPQLTQSASPQPQITNAVIADNSGNTLEAGDSMETNNQEVSEEFYYEELSGEVIDRIKGKSYGAHCDVPYDELRYVRVLYWGFDDETHKGELIVNKLIAEDMVEIFRELYEARYPIERLELVDEYNADDNASMAADNSSSFNYRKIDGTEHLSLHSYGLAVDINPLYNPYVRTINDKTVVLPENGQEYTDRTLDCPYYIDTEDACYQAFIKHGFTWGGNWKDSKDYQHFQKKLQ